MCIRDSPGTGGSAGTNVAPPDPPPVVPPPVPQPQPTPQPTPQPEPTPEPRPNPVPLPIPRPEPVPIPNPEPQPEPVPIRRGCTDSSASNYDPTAQFYQVGSCIYPPEPEPQPIPNPIPVPLPIPSGPGPCIPYYESGQGCPDPVANPVPPPEPGDGFDPCFTPGTVVKMRSPTVDLTNSGVGIGTTSTTILSVDKPISEVKVGDYVLNKDGTQENKVVFIEKHEKKGATLYSPTPDLKPFATKNHMLYKDGEWIVIDDFYPWLRELNCKSVTDPNLEVFSETDLYNLWVTGDGTYIANGYGTHSIMFDGGWLRHSYEQGLLEHKEVIKTMVEFAQVDQPDLMYGAFLVNKLLGKVNIKLLNKIGVYVLCSDESSRRKKIAHKVMRLLAKFGGSKK